MSGRRRKRMLALEMEDMISCAPASSKDSGRVTPPRQRPSYKKQRRQLECEHQSETDIGLGTTRSGSAVSLNHGASSRSCESNREVCQSVCNTKLDPPMYILLQQSLRHIPPGFKGYRHQYLANILSTAMKKNVSAEDVRQFTLTKNLLDESELCYFHKCLPVDLLWDVTMRYQFPYTIFLAPPVSTCLVCPSVELSTHNAPTAVTCYTMQGPLPGAKITLRCSTCGLSYRYDQYGSQKDGYRYYQDHQRPFVRATNTRYVSRECCALWAASGHHAWTSFQASAEIYNELHRSVNNTNLERFSQYLDIVGHEEDDVEMQEEQQDGTLRECRGLVELHRKVVAKAFWNSEIEAELRELKWTDFQFQSPDDHTHVLERIDKWRASNTYSSHHTCSEECRKRGCGTLFSIDGNWKLCYPVCMYSVPKTVSGFKGKLSYVDTCPNAPLMGKAFCAHHCTMAEEQGKPTGLRQFLKFCGVRKQGNPEDDEVSCSDNDLAKVESVVASLQDLNGDTNAADCQGTATFLSLNPVLHNPIDVGDEDEHEKTDCNKETGEKRQLRKWTRGIWMCVSGGGLIQTWQPLYKSEGPAQVFLLVLAWLTSAFGHLPRSEWSKLTISYDNMCHLDNLKVAKELLPLPGDLKYIWNDVDKIIDTLHIRNHKDPGCKVKYTPEKLKEEHPTFNTMSCEQTFVWLSRFKKIVCAMPKHSFHFYLHRLVKRRNEYIEYCYKNKRRPLLPKV